jgi:hypothetical protein
VFLCASKFIGLHIIIKGKPHKVKKKWKTWQFRISQRQYEHKKNVKLKKNVGPCFKGFPVSHWSISRNLDGCGL